MNERIYTLAEQASATRWNDELNGNSIDFSPEQLDKFAELIVRECMLFCDETRSDYLKHRKASDDFTDKNIYAEGEAASDIIKYKMKKHFGVES